jgi:predicted nucleotidyltransferase
VSHPKEADIAELLRTLVKAGVEFIVVGAAAGVIHGATFTTEDLDIVHQRDDDLELRVLDIATLIEVKAKLGRPKDKLAIAHLVAMLEEQASSRDR